MHCTNLLASLCLFAAVVYGSQETETPTQDAPSSGGGADIVKAAKAILEKFNELAVHDEISLDMLKQHSELGDQTLMKKLVAMADTNGNQLLSKDEISVIPNFEYLLDEFTKLDTSGDGTLSKDEVASVVENDKLFARIAEEDGAMQFAEFVQAVLDKFIRKLFGNSRFGDIDDDSSGEITEDEATKFLTNIFSSENICGDEDIDKLVKGYIFAFIVGRQGNRDKSLSQAEYEYLTVAEEDDGKARWNVKSMTDFLLADDDISGELGLDEAREDKTLDCNAAEFLAGAENDLKLDYGELLRTRFYVRASRVILGHFAEIDTSGSRRSHYGHRSHADSKVSTEEMKKWATNEKNQRHLRVPTSYIPAIVRSVDVDGDGAEEHEVGAVLHYPGVAVSFGIVDKDHSGSLNAGEIKKANILKKLDAQTELDRVDGESGSGKVQIVEFGQMLAHEFVEALATCQFQGGSDNQIDRYEMDTILSRKYDKDADDLVPIAIAELINYIINAVIREIGDGDMALDMDEKDALQAGLGKYTAVFIIADDNLDRALSIEENDELHLTTDTFFKAAGDDAELQFSEFRHAVIINQIYSQRQSSFPTYQNDELVDDANDYISKSRQSVSSFATASETESFVDYVNADKNCDNEISAQEGVMKLFSDEDNFNQAAGSDHVLTASEYASVAQATNWVNKDLLKKAKESLLLGENFEFAAGKDGEISILELDLYWDKVSDALSRALFQKYDRDSSGTITKKELEGDLTAKLGRGLTGVFGGHDTVAAQTEPKKKKKFVFF